MSPLRRYFTSVLLFAVADALSSAQVNSDALIGSWNLSLACTNHHGKPGSCIQMKPGSLLITFQADGTWRMKANDQTGTKTEGTYDIHANHLKLKKTDGSSYLSVDVAFSDDSKHLITSDENLIETFDRT